MGRMPRHQAIRSLRSNPLTREEKLVLLKAREHGCSHVEKDSRLMVHGLLLECSCRHRTAIPEGCVGVRLTEFGVQVFDQLQEGTL